MDQAQITKWTRRGIREPVPVHVDDVEIVNMTLQGVLSLGNQISENDSSFYNKRVSIASNTHVFTKPSDNQSILRIWDLKTNAGTVTAASNASPIVITIASHGFSDDAIVFGHSVGGNTAANGTFKITKIGDDSFSLDDSTGNAAWTSGGKFYLDPSNPPEITKKLLKDANLRDRRKWYPRSNEIVVDDKAFSDDIIVDYIARPSAITDIPSEYHMGLVAFNVINLIRIPDRADPEERKIYADMIAQKQTHEGIFILIKTQIDQMFDVSTEPEPIPMGIDFDDYM